MRFKEGKCPYCSGFVYIEQEDLTFEDDTMFCWRCGKESKVKDFNLQYIDEKL